MEDEKYMIAIPGNIKTRMEVINGVGLKELAETIIAGVISAIISVILNVLFNNYLLSIGFFLGITGATFVAVMKDKTNQSIAGTIGNIIKFFKNQRFYKYKISEEEKINEI